MFKRNKDLTKRVEDAHEQVVISRRMLDEVLARQKEARERAKEVLGYAIYKTEGDEYPYTIAHDGNYVGIAKTEDAAHDKIEQHILDQLKPSWCEGELIYVKEEV